ncbi:hypothetical protein KHA93_16240 [Bacillus sp. FJAT-49732]|uniref:Bacterial Ig domain-containing protein n=1 Tax=Lederbergia citrisecunda TaxID=2833583 RepID=A0A942TP83_9BACI|nr:Ig-like domain-containing protein [Lederbergia citrisecunda]MBS4201190.1 hypothetical protein [Lederbergia citrisecunda]
MVRYWKTIFILMLILMCFQGNISVKASSRTYVSGIIKQDTTWTKTGSPYSLTGDITIESGVRLTVEPGITIDGNNRRIIARGDFEAVGNPSSRIKLNEVNVDPEFGSIHLENTDIIQGSLFKRKPNSKYGVTGLILKDSRLFNVSDPLFLWYPVRDLYIERNVFINSCGIISEDTNVGNVYILNNVFYNYINFAVRNNSTFKNSETIVLYNSFLKPKDQFSYALSLPSGYLYAKMTAINNYWGTTNETVIKNMIYDKNIDPASGSYIQFKPYLRAPDQNTPNIKLDPPEKPIVYDVTDKSEYITGKAEKLSVIHVVNENNDLVGEATADSNGNFKITIKSLSVGSKLYVTATDDWFNESEPTIVTVKKFIDVPTVNQITNKSTSVTGKTGPKLIVTVKIGTKAYTAKADAKGNYKVTIPVQNTGTTISITAKDSKGNVSAVKSTKVIRVAPNMPSVNKVNNKSTSVTGKTEPKAIVTVKIGTKTYTAKSDAKGNYKVTIPVQNTGTSISITAKDSKGNISAVRTAKVIRVAPNTPTVNAVNTKSTSVKGKTEPKAVVTVKIGAKTYTAKADGVGRYKVTIPKQQVGTKIYVNAKDKKGSISATRIVTVSK